MAQLFFAKRPNVRPATKTTMIKTAACTKETCASRDAVTPWASYASFMRDVKVRFPLKAARSAEEANRR